MPSRGCERRRDGKTSFLAYINGRFGGFEPIQDSAVSPWAGSREERAFLEFYAMGARIGAPSAIHMACVDDITYTGHEELSRDIDKLCTVVAHSPTCETFMTSISATNVEGWQRNRLYDSQEEFLFAIAEAMREEYEAIVDAGLLLQIDDPGLLTEYTMRPDSSVAECRARARVQVDALNHAQHGPETTRSTSHRVDPPIV